MEESESGSRAGKSRWTAAAIACGIVLVVFPDVIFFSASFRNSRILRVFDSNPSASALIADAEGREIWDGYTDLGAAAWQLEPEHHFIRRCLIEGQSPYWNPYSASGTHGPERLTSMSFSVITVATAALGANSWALHTVLLLTFVLAVYCLYRSLTVFLGCSALAAGAGCLAFLLTGFHVSMIGAQMAQPYVLGPILLLTMLALIDGPTPGRLLRATLASSMLLLETFLPTALLTFVCVHSISLAFGCRRWRRPFADGGRQLMLQAAPSILGLLVVAPLVFPVLESVSESEWNGRRMWTARPLAALSLATPKHFWESYGAFARTRSFDYGILHLNRLEQRGIFHLGIAALLVAFQAFVGRRSGRSPVVWAAGALMGVAIIRIFGLVPSELLVKLPIVSMISDRYWGLMISFPFCILLAYGVDALSSKTVWRWPTLSVLAFLGAGFMYLLGRLGLVESDSVRFHLAVFGSLIAAVLVAFFCLRLMPRARPVIVAALVALIAGELIFYMNRWRPERQEPDFSKIKWTEFLRTQLDDERVLNLGGWGLYPNWGSALGISQIDSLDGVNLRNYSEFFDQRFGKSWHFLALRRDRIGDGQRKLEKFDHDALDLLGVRYLLVSTLNNYRRLFLEQGMRPVFRSQRVAIFENPDPYPRVFAVNRLIEAPGIPSDHDLPGRRLAVTLDGELLGHAARLGIRAQAPSSESEVPAQAPGTVKITQYRHARVVLEANLAEPAVVVLTDTWHRSWRSWVNREPVHLGRVNEVLRGIALPAGQHQIVMTYAPRSLPYAFAVSLLTLAFLGWRVVLARRGLVEASPTPLTTGASRSTSVS